MKHSLYHKLEDIIEKDISFIKHELSVMEELKKKKLIEIEQIKIDIKNNLKDFVHLEKKILKLNRLNWNINVFQSALEFKTI